MSEKYILKSNLEINSEEINYKYIYCAHYKLYSMFFVGLRFIRRFCQSKVEH